MRIPFQRRTWKLLAGVLLLILTEGSDVRPAGAAEETPAVSPEQELQICPMTDGSGSFLIKNGVFFCGDQEGNPRNVPEVHCFERMEIGGTVFDGYYYHGEDGKFHPGDPQLIYLEKLACGAASFDGYFMAENLGKLSAAPQVRYLDHLTVHDQVFDGYYYFDEKGELITEPGIHLLEMDENGRQFRGCYYFGGNNGVLLEQAGSTPEGFPVDEEGKVEFPEGNRMDALRIQLNAMTEQYDGEWSIYVKDLNMEESFAIDSRPMTSASLIKVFILEKTYADMEQVREHEAARLSLSPDHEEVTARIDGLLWDMIVASDNESSNELVRLQSPERDFVRGAEEINTYLLQRGYEDTSVQHTLHPSSSESAGLGGSNTTSVTDCGRILERIYRGTCVSRSASEEMLYLLKNQETDWKIPAGLSEEITVANKTGETDHNQHDIAIVYGPATDYILCVMSENCQDEGDAIDHIQEISRTVFNYLNLYEYNAASE